MRTFFLILVSAISLVSADEKTDPAVASAQVWLGLVDSQHTKESWADAAPFFKERIAEDDWEKLIASVRSPFGALKSRELKSATYTTTLPGAPDGEYVVVQFTTSFQNKAHAVETVTPSKDAKGEWRVAGYFIN